MYVQKIDVQQIRPSHNNLSMKILIDSCHYTFYRVTASASWYRKFAPDREVSLENEEFVEHMESQFWSHLEKFIKRYHVPASEMYNIRDCPIEEIWRRRVLPSYKEKRNTAKSSPYGALIKHLNTKNEHKFKKTIRISGAEADDIIATYVQYSDNEPIMIITGDSDFDQLLAYPHVQIIRPKDWEIVPRPAQNINNVSLVTKILAGDSTDEIPSCFVGCGEKTAEGLAQKHTEVELVKYLLEMSKSAGFENAYSNYLRNRELIDFQYIPYNLRMQILQGFDITTLSTGRPVKPNRLQLGLCCLNTQLRDKDIFCSRKPILKTVETKGFPYLAEQCLKNCQDMITMIEWNHVHGIHAFRISSELFPHYTNPRSSVRFTLDFAQPLLAQAGNLARKYGQRITFHPGQYNVLATPNADSLRNTIADLDMHAEILDRMGCGVDSVMVIHAGGMYGNKDATKIKWAERFRELPERVRRRLVLENCEKCFSIKDCLEVSKLCAVPVVFDTHHFDCYKQMHPAEQFEQAEFYIADILATWRKRGIKPKFHVSEQCDGGQIGKHSDLIENIPEYILNIWDKHKIEVDLQIEAKLKEQAIFKLYKKYPYLDPRLNPSDTGIQGHEIMIKRIDQVEVAQKPKIMIKKIVAIDVVQKPKILIKKIMNVMKTDEVVV